MLPKKTLWVIVLVIFLLPIALLRGQETQTQQLPEAEEGEDTSVKTKNVTYRLETFGSYSTGDQTPFWMVSHSWGVVPLSNNSLYLKAGSFYDQTLSSDLSYNIGLDLVAVSKVPNRNSYWIQQAYAEIKWKSLAFSIGSREQYESAIVNQNLSSGDMVYSNNARPNPEVKISIPKFTPIPYSRNRLYIKGDFAIGKYLDGDFLEKTAMPLNQSFVKNPLSHHKSLYLRLGDIQWTPNAVQWTIGVNDYAQWSGDNYRYKNGEWTNPVSASKNFFDVLIPSNEYQSGSHLASYNFRVDYGRNYADEVYSFYAQHFIEAKDDIFFKNYRDMLVGLEYKSLRKKFLSGLVLEYLYTKNQRANHKSNYYNQPAHQQGSSYYGRGLGNPLLLSPEYNEDGSIGFKSNRISAMHVGLEGHIDNNLQYSFLATYGTSDGTYKKPYTDEKTGIASLLGVTYNYPKIIGLSFKCSVAYNNGEFFGTDTFGAGLTIRMAGKLF
ncbi:MAG: hypothetical protein H6Q14_2969 [Bacteroidetes bacterium]|nr:hypothetical protein [Bacteroidota bacterium]